MLIKISDILKELPDFGVKLEQFHSAKSAALVAGLLIYPPLHANSLRIEMLVHMILAFAGGTKKPKHRHIKSWLNAGLGSSKLVDETKRRGHAFARRVFETMRAQGYEARLEETIPGLLNEKLEKDCGDVDVLAWKTGDNDVLAIECKDLKVAKTPNEMAEQLNRFSGQVSRSGKPDDLLKHVERCNFLWERSQRVAKAIGISHRNIHIRSVVCFSKPVPMQYVAKRFPDVRFLTIDDLSEKLV